MKQNVNFEKVDKNAWSFKFDGNFILVMAHPYFDGYWCGVDGNIYSTKTRGLNKLKIHTTKNGYSRVCLYTYLGKKMFYVHRLVADAWLEESGYDKYGNQRHQINHIDGDKTNNQLCNLERCSAKENIEHYLSVLKY